MGESYDVMFLEVDLDGNVLRGANLAALCSIGWYVVATIPKVKPRDHLSKFKPVITLILHLKRL